jgi:hypothetical protein
MGTEGNGGNITIDSDSFSLRDGAQLLASTFGQGMQAQSKLMRLIFSPFLVRVPTLPVACSLTPKVRRVLLEILSSPHLELPRQRWQTKRRICIG